MNDQERIQIEGKVLDIELKTTRKGGHAAIIKFLTQEKEIEVIAWPEAWESFQSELQIGKTLTIEGFLGVDQEPFTLTDVILNNYRKM